jgi:hypothetical protein
MCEAILSQTAFQNVNLSRVNGLSEIVHRGPSFVDAQTLVRSGPLPPNFLRGCGIPEELIHLLPSLPGQSKIFASCFISFSTKDQAFAGRLHADLQEEGIRCGFAPRDIRGGRKTHEQIEEAIGSHDRVLLILSKHSLSSEMGEARDSLARQKEQTERLRVLFPISLAPFAEIKGWKCFDGDTGKD